MSERTPPMNTTTTTNKQPRPVYAPADTPSFHALTNEQWKQYAHLRHTAAHHKNGNRLPSNITALTCELYNDPNALDQSTVDTALAAGFLQPISAPILTGELTGQTAIYRLSTPQELYGTPAIAAEYPLWWRFPPAVIQDDLLTAQNERVYLNTLHLLTLLNKLGVKDGALPNKVLHSPMLPGEPPLVKSPEFAELRAQNIITGHPYARYKLNIWHHLETAWLICTGRVEAPRPPKDLLPLLIEHSATLSQVPDKRYRLELEHFGWTLEELTTS